MDRTICEYCGARNIGPLHECGKPSSASPACSTAEICPRCGAIGDYTERSYSGTASVRGADVEMDADSRECNKCGWEWAY